MENITFRNETPADYRPAEELTKQAFWNLHVPGCDEHCLLHLLRDCDAFVPELDFVAEDGGKIVGQIVYAKAELRLDAGGSEEVLTFGPVSVLPACQRRGIGSRLIRHTLALAKEMGFRAVLIYGDPDYYRRFGFEAAEKFGIGSSGDMVTPALQALELTEGALTGCAGRFFEGSAYDIDPAAAAAFDKDFPVMEKVSGLPSQERFLQMLGLMKPRRGGNAGYSLNAVIKEYTDRLSEGKIQRAYKGIMDFMTGLKADMEKECPGHAASALYFGYMDMTYFAFTPAELKNKKLKIAVVYLHEENRFELWLAANNRQMQAEVIERLRHKNTGAYAVSQAGAGVDAIIALAVGGRPDFDRPDVLKELLIAKFKEFEYDMLCILNTLKRSF